MVDIPETSSKALTLFDFVQLLIDIEKKINCKHHRWTMHPVFTSLINTGSCYGRNVSSKKNENKESSFS